MTQEQKDILLKDLCARLPYGVKISIPDLWTQEREVEILDEIFKGDDGLWRLNSKGQCIEYIKPYLFPLSSMTEEQRNEYQDKRVELELKALNNEIEYEEVTTFEVDFYLKNHIDYRGLIPMGLAIDATGKNIY